MSKSTVKEDASITPTDEKKIVGKISVVSIVGNAVLSAFKLLAGIWGHSNAMISDSIHSFSDVFTTIIAFFGVRISKKDADKTHPYGHERLECVASLLLGLLLLGTGVGIGYGGIKSIVNGSYATMAKPGTIALVAAILSILCKEGMYWYTRHYAKKINSAAFMADAWHHRSDAFSSVGSLVGVVGAMLGVPILDVVASLVICAFILKVSADILIDAIKKMLDTACDEALLAELTAFIEAQADVVRVDTLRSRMFGNRIYIDLEIAVDGNMTLNESHAIAERVHDTVETRYPDIKHIMIHLNPADAEAAKAKTADETDDKCLHRS